VIFSLCGRVHAINEKESDRVWVELESGVGYEVITNGSILPSDGHRCVFIFPHTTEYGTKLYGFRQMEERLVAEALTSVEGIGPSLAARTIQKVGLVAFYACLRTKDSKQLTRSVPGLGSKRVDNIFRSFVSPLPDTSDPSEAAAASKPELAKVISDAETALAVLLGKYPDRTLLIQLSDEITDGEKLVTAYLRASRAGGAEDSLGGAG